MKLSKTQQYILSKLTDEKWHDESDLHCTRSTLKALEWKGAIEPHPDNDGWPNKWRLVRKCPECGSTYLRLNAFHDLAPFEEQYQYTCGDCQNQFNPLY